MVDLVKWHGSEEIEHRTVAFDLYRHLGGGYMPRYYLSLAVIVLVLGLWVRRRCTYYEARSTFC